MRSKTSPPARPRDRASASTSSSTKASAKPATGAVKRTLAKSNVKPNVKPSKPAVKATAKPTANAASTEANHTALRAWLRLLGCHKQLETRLRALFRHEFATTLPRFDLMAQLARYPDGIKMRHLSHLLMVTSGNITGLTDRMEAEGLIERRDATDDRRAYTLHLTTKGTTQFQLMATRHETWITQLFADLNTTELEQLSTLLAKLKQHHEKV